jgi:predicted nucleic acid-binding protein
MMVLVDTSVWIRALAGKQPHRDNLDELLAAESVLGHEFVSGELLIGDSGGRARILAAYALFAQAPLVQHAEVTALVQARRLHGSGIGWIDAHLLASSMASSATLYTADVPLRRVAEKLGVAYSR